MALSKEEQAQLDALLKKSEEPENGGGDKDSGLKIVLDLSDKDACERAVAFGLLKRSDLIDGAEEDEETEEDEEDATDATGNEEEKPPRKGSRYFKDDKK